MQAASYDLQMVFIQLLPTILYFLKIVRNSASDSKFFEIGNITVSHLHSLDTRWYKLCNVPSRFSVIKTLVYSSLLPDARIYRVFNIRKNKEWILESHNHALMFEELFKKPPIRGYSIS